MNRDYFIKLTSALYEVTELLPEGEPLRFDLRSRANKILIDLAPYHFSENNIPSSIVTNVKKNIEIMESLFSLAREQGWIAEDNFSILEEEYKQLKNNLPSVEESVSERRETKKKIPASFSSPRELASERDRSPSPIKTDNQKLDGITERQKKILKMIRLHPRAGISEIKKEFSDLSKRTIRRDLEKLTEDRLVKRNGEGVSTSYQIALVDKR